MNNNTIEHAQFLKARRAGLACAVFAALMLAASVLPGCATGERPREAMPAPGQARWLDEDEAASTVFSCIEAYKFESQRQLAVRKYALYMRMTYSHISFMGADEDAGARALAFIRHIHFRSSGSKELWRQALAMAKARGEGGSALPLPGLPIPAGFDTRDYRPARPQGR